MSKPLNGRHRSQKDGFWAWIGHEALRRAKDAAGPNGALIYTALCILESKTPTDHKSAFHASAANIAGESGLSARTVARVLPILVKAKLIEMISGRDQRSANTVRLSYVTQSYDRVAYANSARRDGRQKRDSFTEGEKETHGKPEKESPAAIPSEAFPSEASGDGRNPEPKPYKHPLYPWRDVPAPKK